MPSPFDLTSVAAVNAWLSAATSDTDDQVAGLITSASRKILAHLGRPFITPRSWTDRYDVQATRQRITLRNWPVIAVQSVSAGALALSAVSPATPAAGYALEPDRWGGAPPGAPQALDFFDGALWSAGRRQGISVTYTAGYQTTDVVTAALTVSALAPFGAWAVDSGVTYASSGAALTAVASSPAKGQYSVSSGTYTFSAADVGVTINIAYGYVPADLAQACVEIVAHRLAAGSRVGVRSKSLGGQETVSYDISAVPDAVAHMLQPYMKVLPL